MNLIYDIYQFINEKNDSYHIFETNENNVVNLVLTKKYKLFDDNHYFLYCGNTSNYWHFFNDNFSKVYGYIYLKQYVPNLKLLIQPHYQNNKLLIELLSILDINPTIYDKNIIYSNVYEMLSYTQINDHIKQYTLNNNNELNYYQTLTIGNKMSHLKFNHVRSDIIRKLFDILINSSQIEDMTIIKNIYISRRDSNKRKLINETQLIDLLKTYNFFEMIGTQFSMKKKIYLLANCENIISLPGSSLLNCLFCKNCNIYVICNKIDLIHRGITTRIDKSNNIIMYNKCYEFTNQHLTTSMRYRDWRNTYYEWKIDLTFIKNTFDKVFIN
jgi:hypothetical protein